MAQQDVERLESYRFRRVVTGCPHCFNALGNEYRRFGGDFRVLHHTQLLKELVREGRLALPGEAAAKVTCHDSRSFCCGAGGGSVRQEETGGTRVNRLRAREALGAGADTVATACPFCLQMLEDGLKTQGGERAVEARGVVELVAAALGAQPVRAGKMAAGGWSGVVDNGTDIGESSGGDRS